MTRESILIVLGILVALSPWSGLPLDWLMYALVVSGLAVAIIGWTLRERRTVQSSVPVQHTVEPVAPETVPEPAPAPIEEPPEQKPLPIEEAPAIVPARRRSIDMPSRASRIAKF
jgi:hypothetical protein